MAATRPQDAAERDLAALGPRDVELEDEDLAERLARIPDFTQQLRTALAKIKRQLFDAFERASSATGPNAGSRSRPQ